MRASVWMYMEMNVSEESLREKSLEPNLPMKSNL